MKRYILILIIWLVTINVQATIYYVSPSGLDTANGTSVGTAWKTLTKVNSSTFVAGDHILFQKGGTFYGSITISNPGTSGNPITFGAYGTGANPIITGFTTVTTWTNLGSNIWESTNAISSLSTCNMVTVNGVNTAMGRYPNTGYLTYQSHSGNTVVTSSSLTGTPNWTGAELVLRATRWNLYRSNITAQSNGTLTFNSVSNTPTNGYGLFIQNDSRTLDSQNEWYFNPSTKKLRIYSTSQPSNIKCSTGVSGFTIHANYITIQNIDFEGFNSYALTNATYGPNNLKIQNCNIRYSGISGISMIMNTLLVEDCTISDSNNTGIDMSSWVTYGTVRRCTITNSGMIPGMGLATGDGSYCAINGRNSANTNTLVEYSTIQNSGYCGMAFTGESLTVQYNLIDNFCSVKDDGAGFYAWGVTVASSVISNIVLNGIGAPIGTSNTSKYMAEGIYLDDNCANFTVSGNTVSICTDGGIYLHNCNNSSITNNTLYNNTKAIYTGDDALGAKLANMTITGNKFIAKTATQYLGFFYADTNDTNSQNVSLVGTMNNNYYCRPIAETSSIAVLNPDYSETYKTFEEWQSLTSLDANSHKSPKTITSTDDIAFAYNETNTAKTVSLAYTGLDATGTRFGSTVILDPYTSIVVLKDLTNPSNETTLLKSDEEQPLIDDSGNPLVP